jgi:hypothetical protein
MTTTGHFSDIPASGVIIRQEGALLRLYFDVKPVVWNEDDEQEHPADICTAYFVDVQAPFNYGAIVSAIVNDKYTADDVQALQANYIEAKDASSDIASSKREEYLDEWAEFQAWRARAKDLAVTVLAQINQ